jgi:excisionase family DNA binding protein
VGEEFRTYRWGADPTENQQRLTVHDAARRLGISEDAVRMRVKRGKLSANKEGGRLYVLLDIEPTIEPTTDRTDELIEELKDRVHRLEYQLDQEREARTEERRRQDTVIAQLSRANEEQARTIRQLEAPSEARESPQTVEEEPERAEPRPDASGAQEGAQKPLWRRIFGR